jgi:hypothetical protein
MVLVMALAVVGTDLAAPRQVVAQPACEAELAATQQALMEYDVMRLILAYVAQEYGDTLSRQYEEVRAAAEELQQILTKLGELQGLARQSGARSGDFVAVSEIHGELYALEQRAVQASQRLEQIVQRQAGEQSSLQMLQQVATATAEAGARFDDAVRRYLSCVSA